MKENEIINRLQEENNNLLNKLQKANKESKTSKELLSKSKIELNQLKEKIDALKLEFNLAAAKQDHVSVGIQTEIPDNSSDASSLDIMLNLREMINLPQVLSPFSTNEDTGKQTYEVKILLGINM